MRIKTNLRIRIYEKLPKLWMFYEERLQTRNFWKIFKEFTKFYDCTFIFCIDKFHIVH